jgi:hypothetical protein
MVTVAGGSAVSFSSDVARSSRGAVTEPALRCAMAERAGRGGVSDAGASGAGLLAASGEAVAATGDAVKARALALWVERCGASPRSEPATATAPITTMPAPTAAQGIRLERAASGACERGMARVAGSSAEATESSCADGATSGGAEDVAVPDGATDDGVASAGEATGGVLASLRVHSTKSSRAANVRVIGAEPGGVCGMGGVAGVCSALGGGLLENSACGDAAGVC